MNVFDIEDIGGDNNSSKAGRGKKSTKPSTSSSNSSSATDEGVSPTATAVVARPRDCTMCRECVRHVDAGWEQRVQVRRLFISVYMCLEGGIWRVRDGMVGENVVWCYSFH